MVGRPCLRGPARFVRHQTASRRRGSCVADPALAALWLAYPFAHLRVLRAEPEGCCGARRTDLGSRPVRPHRAGPRPRHRVLGADIQHIKGEHPETKVIVITGDSNEAAKYIRHLLPAWPGRRYVATLIDAPGASFDWEALDILTAGERMDLMFLFPEDMDLERNARTDATLAAGQARLDPYFANPTTWRETVGNPGTRDLGLALRRRYKADMTNQLGCGHFGREFRVSTPFASRRRSSGEPRSGTAFTRTTLQGRSCCRSSERHRGLDTAGLLGSIRSQPSWIRSSKAMSRPGLCPGLRARGGPRQPFGTLRKRLQTVPSPL